jgi:hypothetical protein
MLMATTMPNIHAEQGSTSNLSYVTEPTQHIIVESFILKNTSGHRGDVHMRPAAGQVFPQTLLVQCNKAMLDTSKYPVATKFKYRVRLVTTAKGTQFLGSHHAWPFEVIDERTPDIGSVPTFSHQDFVS